MTSTASRPRLPLVGLAATLLALLVLLPPATGRAEDDDAVVARVGGKVLTRKNLAGAVVWRVRQDLLEMGSGALTILRQMVEEQVVQQEAQRLGVGVAPEDVRRRYDEYDTQVRDRSNGAKTLEDVILRDQKITVSEFMKNLKHQMLKERVASHQQYLGPLPRDEESKIAQIEVVIAELLKKAKIEYGLPTALQSEPTDLGAGIVVRVNGQGITLQAYGEELIDRLPTARIKAIIQEECKAALTAQYALSVDQMDDVIQMERDRWDQFREMTTQEAMKGVSYEDYVKMKYRLDLDQLKQDRYFRGLYGLVRSFREQLKPEEVQADYEAKKDTVYGDRFLVTDVQILFSPRQALLGPSVGRERRDALQLANGVLRRTGSGIPFEEIVREINDKQDATFFGRRLRVRNTANERLLYDQAKMLEDGQVSRPFETLAEVHVLRREQWIPAPTFEQVEDMVRQALAFNRAHEWLEARIEDPETVQIDWPPAGR